MVSLRRMATMMALAATLTLGALQAMSQAGFLTENDLRAAIVGHSLRGSGWMEFYAPDGIIYGKTRLFGVRSYTGRWTVMANRVCYDYDGSSYDTCSRLQMRDGKVYHYDLDGNLKNDGVATRTAGDQLDTF